MRRQLHLAVLLAALSPGPVLAGTLPTDWAGPCRIDAACRDNRCLRLPALKDTVQLGSRGGHPTVNREAARWYADRAAAEAALAADDVPQEVRLVLFAFRADAPIFDAFQVMLVEADRGPPRRTLGERGAILLCGRGG